MVKLSEKYIRLIREYVESIDRKEWYVITREGSPGQRLAKMVESLHPTFMDNRSASWLILTTVSGYLRETNELPSSDPVDNAPPYLADELIALLVAEVESLPRSYELAFELPFVQGLPPLEVELAPDMHLVSGRYDFDLQFDKALILASALMKAATPCKTYVRVRTQGYIARRLESETVRAAMTRVKQAVFVLTSHGALYSSLRVRDKVRCVSTRVDNDWSTAVTLPYAMSECLSLELGESTLKVFVRGKNSLLDLTERLAVTADETIQALDRHATEVRKFFSSEPHRDFQSIAAAIEWYQDSMNADNETYAFIAACIGLEALLGDESHLEEMTKRLTDRFSFLLGSGRADRDRLAAEYRSILGVRGRLVHAKQSRLSADDHKHLSTVRDMLYRVIWRELTSLYERNVTS